MKSMTTLRRFFTKKEGWLVILIVLAVLVTNCYQFFSIEQPTEAYANSSFEVNIVVKDTMANDFTVENLQDIGLLGVMLPDGWTVTDNVQLNIVATDPDFNNTGTLVHSTALSVMLEDSIGSPENYHWWGAETTADVDMSFFDSLYFTVSINTDAQVGTFSLRYTVGDQDYWDRNPYNVDGGISDPMPIEITAIPGSSVKTNETENFTVFPNPTSDIVNIDLDWDNNSSAEVKVYNIAGKLMNSFIISKDNSSINIESYPKGAYLFKIDLDDSVVTQKVLLR